MRSPSTPPGPVGGRRQQPLIEFAPGATGDAPPLPRHHRARHAPQRPRRLTIDAAGNLLVTNLYGAVAGGVRPVRQRRRAPLRTIAGSNTGLALPQAVDVDATGTIYVANEFGGVSEFAANASGNATPTGVISGPDTALDSPWGLAVAPPLWIRTTRLPRAQLGRRYALQLAPRWARPRTVARHRRPPPAAGYDSPTRGAVVGRPRHRGVFRVRIAVRDHTRPAMRAARWFRLQVR